MALIYKVVYTPNKDTKTLAIDSDINFLCSDKKLHIRLRDYDHEEVISGFINKLTYVITYLIQRCDVGTKSDDEIISNFVKNDTDFKNIDAFLQQVFSSRGLDYRGIKISKSYRKVKTSKNTLGSFKEGTCYLEDNCKFGDFTFLTNSLGLDFVAFLLNDAVDLVITKDSLNNSYTKFVNKKLRKVNKNKLEYIPLF